MLVATLVGCSPAPPPRSPSVPPPVSTGGAPARVAPVTVTLGDGRTVRLAGLGGEHTAALLTRIAAEIGGAAGAVTAFWGADWPHEIVIIAAGSDAEFQSLAGGLGSGTAAAAAADHVDPEHRSATGQRIVFAPGAAAMSDDALRIVLRHELFHYAARAETALDAPRWLTEGVADFVARPPAPPAHAGAMALGPRGSWGLPTDAELDAAEPARSLAYDRAWWFSRFVAQRYGVATLRALYIRACGAGHSDVATAMRDTLGAELPVVLSQWRQWLSG